MDNFRLILLFALAFVLLLLYQAWIQDYGAISPPVTKVSSEKSSSPVTNSEQTVPSVPVAAPGPDTSQKGDMAIVPEPMPHSTGGLITVETDVFKAEISTRGGTIQNIYLLDYPVSPEYAAQKFQLLKPDQPNLYLAQSGLIGTSKDTAPTHEAIFESFATGYELAEDKNELSVELVWTHESGVKVIKRYLFKRGSYLIDLTQNVINQSESNWAARSYVQLQRSEPYYPEQSSFIYTFTGAAYYSPEDKYEKIPFEEIAEIKLNREITNGWAAMLQHYFLSAWIPPRGESQTIFTNQLSGPRYVIGMYSSTINVSPGASHTFSSQLYTGPKLQNELSKVAEGLELSVDYGWLTILAQPIFWLLDKLHSLVNNWGVAIILLTIVIKLAFYKLSETSYKSMANMRKLTPRLQALKDRYGDDKERLNKAMMEMYKKEKINPLGGCLPIVVQIPVFIALYWVLLESVELRQAPFALWINNLSAPDPYFILPLIMGVSMFIQQKLNPAPVDPLQAKIMMSLPLVFTVFFAFFPAGLVLYWTVNNILSIAQQWHITRNIEKSAKSH
jgi:YidC/Oxa1 family membrane protein insertase